MTRLAARALFVIAVTGLATVTAWSSPVGVPVVALLAVAAGYILGRLLGAGALAVGRHARAGGGQ